MALSQKSRLHRLIYIVASPFSVRASAAYARRLVGYASVAALIGLSACSSMTHAQKHTAIGSAAGGALGYIVTGGPIGTIGGAVVGGVIGAKH